jgi:hypothetical protein
MKNKETLEEAMSKDGYHESDYDKIWREGVQFGVKWQQEQDKNKYSEEDLEVAYFEGKEGLYSFNEWFEQFKKK